MIDKSLLDMLICPQCGNSLKQIGQELVCEKEQLAYPIINNIPILLVERAVKLKKVK